MASDLISRSAVIKALKNEKREAERDGEEYGGESILYAEAYVDAIELVKRIPAVDAVEVVRCKDCNSRIQPCGMVLHCSLNGIEVDDDDFCSYGERVKKDAVD